MATLSATSTTATTTVNIETQGPDHWLKFQQSGATNRKTTGATSGISTFSQIGSFTTAGYNNDPRTITWTNGTPTSSGSDAEGLYTGNTAVDTNGFSFTLDADTSVRTAKFYFGNFGAAGRFTATLSDGSATMSAVDFSDPGNASQDCNITVTFQAASAGQTLTVNWVILSHSLSFGNVAINGIALTIAAAVFVPPARRFPLIADAEAPPAPGRPDIAAILAPAPVVNSPIGRPMRPQFDQPDPDLAQRRTGIAAATAPAAAVAQVPFLARRSSDTDDQSSPVRRMPSAAPFNPTLVPPAGATKQAVQDWAPGPPAPPRTTGVPLLPATAPIAQPPVARRLPDWSDPEGGPAGKPRPAAILAPYVGAPAGPTKQAAQDWTDPQPPQPFHGAAAITAPVVAPSAQPYPARRAPDAPDPDAPSSTRPASAATQAPYVGAPAGPTRQPWQDWSPPPHALPRAATAATQAVAPAVVQTPPARAAAPAFETDWMTTRQSPGAAAITAPAPVVNAPPGRTARAPGDWDTTAPPPPPRAAFATTTVPPVVNAPPGRRPPASADWAPPDQAPTRQGLVAAFSSVVAAAVPLLRRIALVWPDEEASVRARPSVAPAIADTRLIDPIPQRAAQAWSEDQALTMAARQALAALIQPAAAPPPRAPMSRWAESAETIAAVRRQIAAAIAPPPAPPDAPPPRRRRALELWTDPEEMPIQVRFRIAAAAVILQILEAFPGRSSTTSGTVLGGPTSGTIVDP